MDNKEFIEGNMAILKDIQKDIKDKDLVIAVYKEVCKDRRMIWIDMHKSKGGGGSQPATEKQIAFLKSLTKGEVPDGLTKFAASKMIEDLTKNGNN